MDIWLSCPAPKLKGRLKEGGFEVSVMGMGRMGLWMLCECNSEYGMVTEAFKEQAGAYVWSCRFMLYFAHVVKV